MQIAEYHKKITSLGSRDITVRVMTPDGYESGAKRYPVVLHYLGDERPWIAGNRNHYRKLYETYLDRTPWKGTPKQTGKELYMFLWWGLNKATLLCPGLRLWISRRFGMKVIDARKKS